MEAERSQRTSTDDMIKHAALPCTENKVRGVGGGGGRDNIIKEQHLGKLVHLPGHVPNELYLHAIISQQGLLGRSRNYYYPHSTDKETDAQKSWVIYSRPES